MYCSGCGNQVPEGAAFCPFCGTKTAAEAAGSVSDRMAVRRSEEAELERMISYFSRCSALYAEYDELTFRLDRRNLRKRKGLLVWGILALVLSAILTVIGISEGLRDPLIAAAVNAAGATLMIAGFIFSSVEKTRNYNKARARFDAVADALTDNYRGYGPCLLSAEYTNPAILAAILDTMSSGRADTVKEALNALIEDYHRENMESLARLSAISSAEAARGANAAAIFAAANLFTRR